MYNQEYTAAYREVMIRRLAEQLDLWEAKFVDDLFFLSIRTTLGVLSSTSRVKLEGSKTERDLAQLQSYHDVLADAMLQHSSP